MTVQNTATKNIYVGNGSTTEFPITFEVNEAHPEYIHVYTGAAEAASVETTNFDVDLVAKKVTYPKTGEPLAAGLKLIISRELPLTQSLNLINQGDYFAEDVEQAFDDNVMIAQQLHETLSRAVLMDISVDGDSFDTTLKLIPGKAIKINDEGAGFDLTDDPAVLKPQVESMLAQATTQANIATNAANAALTSETNAKDSENAAAESEQNAAESEQNAAASAAAALASEQAAFDMVFNNNAIPYFEIDQILGGTDVPDDPTSDAGNYVADINITDGTLTATKGDGTQVSADLVMSVNEQEPVGGNIDLDTEVTSITNTDIDNLFTEGASA